MRGFEATAASGAASTTAYVVSSVVTMPLEYGFTKRQFPNSPFPSYLSVIEHLKTQEGKRELRAALPPTVRRSVWQSSAYLGMAGILNSYMRQHYPKATREQRSCVVGIGTGFAEACLTAPYLKEIVDKWSPASAERPSSPKLTQVKSFSFEAFIPFAGMVKTDEGRRVLKITLNRTIIANGLSFYAVLQVRDFFRRRGVGRNTAGFLGGLFGPVFAGSIFAPLITLSTRVYSQPQQPILSHITYPQNWMDISRWWTGACARICQKSIQGAIGYSVLFWVAGLVQKGDADEDLAHHEKQSLPNHSKSSFFRPAHGKQSDRDATFEIFASLAS